SGRRRCCDADRHASRPRSRQHGRSRLRPDQAHRDRDDRQAVADHARCPHHVLDRERRCEILRNHSGDVRGILPEPQRAEPHAPLDPAKRHSLRDHLQRAYHHRTHPARPTRRQVSAGECVQIVEPQSHHLRCGRRHHSIHRHQGNRYGLERHWPPFPWPRLRKRAMLKELRPAIVLLVLLTALTGLTYPLAMTGIAQAVFPWQANGSLIEKDGKVVGSALIGKSFAADKYFHGRPSAISAPDPKDPTKTISTPYDASNSMGSNLGPTSKALVDGVKDAAEQLHAENPAKPVPVDLVTASGSGLDPDITPAAAQFQIPRVAKARNLPESDVSALVARFTQGRALGIFGEPHVNVLELNMALDAISQGKQ